MESSLSSSSAGAEMPRTLPRKYLYGQFARVSSALGDMGLSAVPTSSSWGLSGSYQAVPLGQQVARAGVAGAERAYHPGVACYGGMPLYVFVGCRPIMCERL